MGTISAPMAVATKSKYKTKSLTVSPFLDANACMSLKPTPQPHNSLKGYSQSSCLGSKTAFAVGISAPGL